jgi:hypothetical protein
MRRNASDSFMIHAASDSTRPMTWPAYKRAAASAVRNDLLDWCGAHPALAMARNGSAILWTALLTAYTFDGHIDTTARDFAAQSLALFMYDEVIDDQSGRWDKAALDAPTVMRTAFGERHPGAVEGSDAASTEEQLLAAFADCMGQALQRSVSPLWSQSFRGLVEQTVRGHFLDEDGRILGGHVQSFAEHLRRGSYTIGAPIVAFGAAMTTLPPDLNEAYHDEYRAACLDMGWCVRAVNDFAGFAGDVETGQPNALAIGIRETGLVPAQLARTMYQEVCRKIEMMQSKALDGSHPLVAQYRWLTNCARFHVDWYLTKKSYLFTVEDWLAFDASDGFPEAMLRVL